MHSVYLICLCGAFSFCVMSGMPPMMYTCVVPMVRRGEGILEMALVVRAESLAPGITSVKRVKSWTLFLMPPPRLAATNMFI